MKPVLTCNLICKCYVFELSSHATLRIRSVKADMPRWGAASANKHISSIQKRSCRDLSIEHQPVEHFFEHVIGGVCIHEDVGKLLLGQAKARRGPRGRTARYPPLRSSFLVSLYFLTSSLHPFPSLRTWPHLWILVAHINMHFLS